MSVAYRYAEVDGARIFYREAGPAGAPVLLLLHGFPSASHQYARLIDRLAGQFRVIAPDLPGFGRTETPEGYTFTFDQLGVTMTGFVRALGLESFHLYGFDYGLPVGLRIAEAEPARLAGLFVQNGNAYTDGLSEVARGLLSATPEQIRPILEADGTRMQYLTGTRDPEAVDPDSWLLDQHYLDLPGRKDIQVSLALDYGSNVEAYPRWQAWLREHQPAALVLWGTGDPFFLVPGAHAYLRDLPDAELHLFDTGHFALVEDVDAIAALISKFIEGN
ncbi:alpha/beta fold hydrolase [Longispora albida]|uniref:alpha/beta fold hydrolase n=1 Tax=Longispora albida TaxID=203523 RepID=UPI0003798A9D|nr:alpha/beta fold hydrolase [Longispora albida]